MSKCFLQAVILFVAVAIAAYALNSGSDVERSTEITVQVATFIVLDDARQFSSERSNDDAVQLVREANLIWEPANITFNFTGVEFLFVNYDRFINDLFASNARGLPDSGAHIQVFFVNEIAANGVAFSQVNNIVVKDVTTVNSYRTVAHELGHLLGLPHVFDSTSKLMYRGTNGEILTAPEIEQARNQARLLAEES